MGEQLGFWPLPDLGMDPDPRKEVPFDDPDREEKRQINRLKLEFEKVQNETGQRFGIVYNLDQGVMQVQINAIMRYLCENRSDRVAMERCFWSAALDAARQAYENAPKAVLLGQTPPPQQIEVPGHG